MTSLCSHLENISVVKYLSISDLIWYVRQGTKIPELNNDQNLLFTVSHCCQWWTRNSKSELNLIFKKIRNKPRRIFN